MNALLSWLGFRAAPHWRSDVSPGCAALRLCDPPRPGFYLLSLQTDPDLVNCQALCNGSQSLWLRQGRLRRRLVRIARRRSSLHLELRGLQPGGWPTLLRLSPLLPLRARWLLARKLLRLHPAYTWPYLFRRSLPQQWRDYNRLLSRRSTQLLGYQDWLLRQELPALRHESKGLRAGATSALAESLPSSAARQLLLWLSEPVPQASACPAAQSLGQQWPSPWQLSQVPPALIAPEDLSADAWLLLISPADRVAPQALHRFHQALLHHPDALILYADEDRLSPSGQRHSPQFKPAWNPDLLLSDPHYSQSWLIRADLWRAALEALRRCGEPVCMLSLVLEAAAVCRKNQIVHIPEVLHHIADSGLQGRGSAETAAVVERFLRRHGQPAEVSVRDGGGHRLQWPLPASPPLVSVIIPSRDHADLLQRCLASLDRCGSADLPMELLLIDNGSCQPESLELFAALERSSGVRVLRRPGPFNYAALNNEAAELARGSLLAFLNNDVEAIQPGWLREMASQALRPGIGAVGARLLFDDGTVQHAGVILGIGGIAGHAHKYLPADAEGYQHRLRLSHNLSAVTAAALVMQRDRFEAVGGFDATNFAVNYNDVDLCLRLQAAGYRNLYCADAVLFHHESRSRGAPRGAEALRQWHGERAAMQALWPDLLKADPYYSPHLSRTEENLSIGLPVPIVQPPRLSPAACWI